MSRFSFKFYLSLWENEALSGFSHRFFRETVRGACGFDESGVCFADQSGRCDGDWGQWVAVSVSIFGGGRVSSTELIFSISLKSYVVISFLSWG